LDGSFEQVRECVATSSASTSIGFFRRLEMEPHGALQADDCLKESGAGEVEIASRQLVEFSGQAKVRDAIGVEIPRVREPFPFVREFLRLDSQCHPLLSKWRIPRSEVVLLHSWNPW
jgi:hypothetical protein